MSEYSGPPPHTCDAPEQGGVCSVCGMTWHGITTPDGPWDASPTKDLDDLARIVSGPLGYLDAEVERVAAAREALAELLQRAKQATIQDYEVGDSLRLELQASEHNRKKDNEYLLAERDALRAALEHFWSHTTCPCGARKDHLDTHPHVMGCPVGAVLGGTIADAYEAAVAPPPEKDHP